MEMYLNQTPVCRFSGKVIRGRGLGRLTGMPTANLQVLPDLLPPCGVYVTSLTWRGRPFHGITNIAENPAGGCVSAETHILNFSENLYGENLSLSLFSRLRLQRSFSTLSRLLDQLRRDCDAVREFFGIRLPEYPLYMDIPMHLARFCGEEIPFSPKEFDLLYLFYTNPDAVFPKERLYEAVWHQPSNGFCHPVENTVFQIRRRLRPCAGGRDIIQTVNRCGYKFGG